MSDKTVDVIIPTYKPGKELELLIKRLRKQTLLPGRIILINTQEEFFPTLSPQAAEVTEVYHISKKEFDHGATRHLGMTLSEADYVLFLTMDAVPVNKRLIEKLLAGFEEKGTDVAVVYGRQVPKKDCRPMECYTRKFNYPAKSSLKTAGDLKNLGVKTYFCSDVCAMYDRNLYFELGGFPQKAIFNEDMIYAAGAIKAGYGIFYQAEAVVCHSHNYSLSRQLSRNFDLGVSQKMHPEVFEGVSSEGEGIRLVFNTAKYLVDKGHPFEVVYLLASSLAKYTGYLLGKNYTALSRKTILKLTSNREFWDNMG